jgi:hypothetical protein
MFLLNSNQRSIFLRILFTQPLERRIEHMTPHTQPMRLRLHMRPIILKLDITDLAKLGFRAGLQNTRKRCAAGLQKLELSLQLCGGDG